MSRRRIGLVFLAPVFSLLDTGSALAQSASSYFPERFDGQRRMPAQVGMNAALLNETLVQSFGVREPYFGGLLGATRPRAAINGLIVRRAQVVAEWATRSGSTWRTAWPRSISPPIWASPEWISQARTPGAANVDDGLCQLVRCPGIEFYVPGQRAERDLRRSAERLAGGGGWIDNGSALNDQFIGRVLAAPKN